MERRSIISNHGSFFTRNIRRRLAVAEAARVRARENELHERSPPQENILPRNSWHFSTMEQVHDNSPVVHLDWEYSDEDEVPDAHGDMRADVDGMSYEELIDLEESIGTVDCGLTTETIQERLRRRKYKFLKLELSVGDELCTICQEDYVEDDELGKLDCGHEFHSQCIEKWLVLKNVCPICKKTALDDA